MATPEYPSRCIRRQEQQHGDRGSRTFLVLGETEVDVPAGDQNHVIAEILPLDLGLLHHNDVGFQGVKHGLQLVSPACFSSGGIKTRSRRTWNVRFSRHGWYPNGFRIPLTARVSET
jgi:hypothetical protein